MTITTLAAHFDGQHLDIYTIHGTRWVRGNQIGYALGLTFPRVAMDKIHKRNAEEFGPDDTMIVDLPTAGGIQPTRVFSQKGVVKIAMFARSAKAAAFRDWAARMLTSPQPAPELLLAPALSLSTQRELSIFWLKHPANRKFIRYAAKALNNAEIALLCGWKCASTVRAKRRTAEALGLIAPPANLASLQSRGGHFAPRLPAMQSRSNALARHLQLQRQGA